MNFIDREKELENLNKEYKKDNSFVVLYGRRRVGKTTLIKTTVAHSLHLTKLLNLLRRDNA